MNLKKSYGLLFVLLLTPLVLVGVVQSVGPPTISINLSSYGIYVYGSGWTANADVTIYSDVEHADYIVALVKTNYAGNFQTYIPTNYVALVGTHTVIAVQGVDKAIAVYDVGVAAPPDYRLLNPIQSIKTKLESVDTEVKAIEAKLDPNGSFYNFTNDWFGTINETIVEKVDYEALEVEVQTIQYDTPIDEPFLGNITSNTQVGGADKKSTVYVLIALRGVPIDNTNLVYFYPQGYLADFFGGAISIHSSSGKVIYELTVDPGLPVGSYLVEVEAHYYVSSDLRYYGTASYMIDCTSTTT